MGNVENIRQFWSDIIDNEEIPVQNRMKASELLYRSLQSDEGGVTVSPSEPELAVTERIQAAKAIIAKYAERRKHG